MYISVTDSTSASHISSWPFGLSNSPFQWSQFLMSKKLSVAVFLSLLDRRLTIVFIPWIFDNWNCPAGRSFADTAGGKGDIPGNLNAVATSCWKCHQDALTISTVAEMSSKIVLCSFRAWDCFCVAHRFCLPFHISKLSWTMAIWWSFFSSASLFTSKLISVLVLSNAGWWLTNITIFSQADCLTMSVSWTVSPLGFDCLQLKNFYPRYVLACTPTTCCMIENILHATIVSLAYIESGFSC